MQREGCLQPTGAPREPAARDGQSADVDPDPDVHRAVGPAEAGEREGGCHDQCHHRLGEPRTHRLYQNASEGHLFTGRLQRRGEQRYHEQPDPILRPGHDLLVVDEPVDREIAEPERRDERHAAQEPAPAQSPRHGEEPTPRPPAADSGRDHARRDEGREDEIHPEVGAGREGEVLLLGELTQHCERDADRRRDEQPGSAEDQQRDDRSPPAVGRRLQLVHVGARAGLLSCAGSGNLALGPGLRVPAGTTEEAVELWLGHWSAVGPGLDGGLAHGEHGHPLGDETVANGVGRGLVLAGCLTLRWGDKPQAVVCRDPRRGQTRLPV